ncbi:MAG: IS3 family transposase [Chloroflexi bacterium]|nr:IS3 family transposase [Chloroflexota bacterium]
MRTLLGLPRATYYYKATTETPLNLKLMRLLDEQYLKTPFYGYPRMIAHLRRAGLTVNPKRVRRLMRTMGLTAIYPKPRTTRRHPEHRIYPYLLRGVAITRPNQVWSADITYLPMLHGFMYLVAVMDWYSRYVLAWELSNTLDGAFCLTVLQQALQSGTPEVFNTDQGVQFTAHAFTGAVETAGIQMSMDGRGRALDNIFIERLWRSVKYEDVYLKDYATVPLLDIGLHHYFSFWLSEILRGSSTYGGST